MVLLETVNELKTFVDEVNSQNKVLGFVPTMGALHQGHLSLVAQSLKKSQVTLVSIFVNPTQFNNLNDLKNYPRNIEADLLLLKSAGCHAVFVPDEKQMYPQPDTRVFDFDGLDTLMEGAHRPGHFNGVAQIVSKLFDMVQPQMAFFGQKDFQQLAIIKKMVQMLDYKIEIVGCPILREPDGLAMSSRNVLLTSSHRKAAPHIYKVLKQSVSDYSNFSSIADLKDWVIGTINQTPELTVEYFEIVNAQTLQPIEQIGAINGTIGCIAVWADNVRLIDNITYNY